MVHIYNGILLSYKKDAFESVLMRWVKVNVAQSCPTLCKTMNYSPWNLQARILEWVAFPFSRGSSQPRDQTQVSHIADRFFTTREALSAPPKAQTDQVTAWEASPGQCCLVPNLCQNSSAGLELHSFTTLAEIMSAFPFQIPCRSLAWRILSITLLVSEMSAIVR